MAIYAYMCHKAVAWTSNATYACTVSVKSDATYFLILRTIFVWMPLSVLLALF